MKKSIFYIISITFSYIILGQNRENVYHEAFELVDVWLAAQKDYESIPSIIGAVVKDQEIIWSQAFGNANVEDNQLSTTSTICSICSMSKTFTAVAILKLVDEGKISLDDRVKDILPGYSIKQSFPEGGHVTVGSLLSHSSGVPRDTDHGYWSGPNFPFPTKDEFLESISRMETSYPVNTDVTYSNLGYVLLGLIIEEISGISYKDYIETNIFQALDMYDSFVEMQESLYGNKHAVGYTAINRDGKRRKANFYQTEVMQPAAGISTTVLDLAKYVSWQFRLLDSATTEILTPFTLKKLHTPQATSKNGRSKRSFGFEVFTDEQGDNWTMHGGICPGYVAFLKMNITDKMAYVVLANANGVRALRYVNGIIDILNNVEKTNIGNDIKRDMSQYEGFYNLNPWNSEYYISSWNNGLVALYLPSESLNYSMYFYEHKKDDIFQLVLENGDLSSEKLVFFRNDEGEVVKVKNEGNYHYKSKIQN